MKKKELKKKSESRLRAIKSSYKDLLYAYIDSINTYEYNEVYIEELKDFFF